MAREGLCLDLEALGPRFIGRGSASTLSSSSLSSSRRKGLREESHPQRQSTPRRKLREAQLTDKKLAFALEKSDPRNTSEENVLLTERSENLENIISTARKVAEKSLKDGIEAFRKTHQF